ncbi:MAG: MarR family transcriptional regulator [Chloroflexi bacterium]|nr:MarR family transcriptional regulator [Chloroflexota bacterium]
MTIDSNAHAQAIRGSLQSLAGDADLAGMELVRLIGMVATAYASAVDENLRDAGLSWPRLGLLLRLMAEERCGVAGGLSPTHLSHHQNVSKNTISALLRGLEEQGLIERTLDADDHRVFRIRLTDAGRQIIQAHAPGHIRLMNELAAGLTAEERQQLTALLTKLHQLLMTPRTESVG